MKNYSNEIIDPNNMKVERRKILFVLLLAILASTAVTAALTWITADMLFLTIVKTCH